MIKRRKPSKDFGNPQTGTYFLSYSNANSSAPNRVLTVSNTSALSFVNSVSLVAASKYPQANPKGLRLRKVGKSSHSQELNTSPLPSKSSIRKGRTAKSLDNLSLRSVISNVSRGSSGGTGDVAENRDENHTEALRGVEETRSKEKRSDRKRNHGSSHTSPRHHAHCQPPSSLSPSHHSVDPYNFPGYSNEPQAAYGNFNLGSNQPSPSFATSALEPEAEDGKSHISSDSNSNSNLSGGSPHPFSFQIQHSHEPQRQQDNGHTDVTDVIENMGYEGEGE